MDASQVFLSYSSEDREEVIAVCSLLGARGITTFLDRNNLVPGLPWPQALEQGLCSARAVAVFIGRQLGGWQKREMWFALDRQVSEEKQGRAFPVVPVLLPGADLSPIFLFSNTWIDLRNDGPEAAEAIGAIERAVNASVPVPEGLTAVKRTSVLCPYRGLQAFREEDSAFFAGRSDFAKQLLGFTLGKDLVAVVGPSGSGKSSLVQAGLVPLLRRERLPSKTWDAVTFTPGNDPFHRLASALIPLLEPDHTKLKLLAKAEELGSNLAAGKTRLEAVINLAIANSNGTGRLLVVADQFEELFTQTPEPDRRAFVAAVLGSIGQAPFTLLITLRADFYSQAIGLAREVSDRLPQSQLNVGALTSAELEESIARPAKLIGLNFEPGLKERILADVGSAPGYLPLAEFALTELWQRRQGALLTNQAYNEIGGVAGALAQRAELEFAKFTPEQQAAARRLFSRLVRVAKPEEAGGDIRHRLVVTGTDAVTQGVVQSLAQADVRLLVTSSDERTGGRTVELVHEALIRNWPRLGRWVNEDRDFLLWRQKLNDRIEEWNTNGQAKDWLLRGPSLLEAKRWRLERLADLHRAEREYILASNNTATRARRAVLATAVFVLIATIGMAVAAFSERAVAIRQRQVATAHQLAAQSELIRNEEDTRLQRSVLLAIESVRRAPSIESEQALQGGLTLLPIPVARMAAGQDAINGISFSPDGRYLATASDNGEAIMWEVATGRRIVRMDEGNQVRSITFSPDGRYLAAANGEGKVRVCTPTTGKEVTVVTHADAVWGVAFSPDGRRMATASADHTARLWDVASGREILQMMHAGRVYSVAFSPNAHYLATGSDDNTAAMWDLANGRQIAHWRFKSTVWSIAFSPDGEALAAASEDGTARVWKTRTRREVARIMHGGAVNQVAFSPDGRYLATASTDHTARVWETTGREIARMTHGDAVLAVSFSPDGRHLVTASRDGTARIWEGASGLEIARVVEKKDVVAVAFSPDGHQFATASQDGTARVWQASRSHEVAHLADEQGPTVVAVAFSSDARYVAVQSNDHGPQVWEVSSGQEVARTSGVDASESCPTAKRRARILRFSVNGRVLVETDGCSARVWELSSRKPVARVIPEEPVDAVALSSDGGQVVTASDAGAVQVWDLATSVEIERRNFEGRVLPSGLSPEGRYLATTTGTPDDPVVTVWEVGTGRKVTSLLLPRHLPGRAYQVRRVIFSADGRFLAVSSSDSRVRVWGVSTGRQVASLKLEAPTPTIAFDPDGQYLAVAGSHVVQVLEIATSQEVARIPAHNSVDAATFASARSIATVSRDHIIQVWRWQPEDIIADACSRLTENLTEEEWSQYLGQEPYRQTCEKIP